MSESRNSCEKTSKLRSGDIDSRPFSISKYLRPVSELRLPGTAERPEPKPAWAAPSKVSATDAALFESIICLKSNSSLDFLKTHMSIAG
jgi:hypothetical protein